MKEFPAERTRVQLPDGRIGIFECQGPDTLNGECSVLVGEVGKRERIITNIDQLKVVNE